MGGRRALRGCGIASVQLGLWSEHEIGRPSLAVPKGETISLDGAIRM